MSRAWLVDVLDRELPEMIGANRDRLADAILDALPLEHIDSAIRQASEQQLRTYVSASERAYVAKDISGNAAMAVVGVLGDADVDEQLHSAGAVALAGDGT